MVEDVNVAVCSPAFLSTFQQLTNDQSFSRSIQRSLQADKKIFIMPPAPPSLEFILHDGKTGEVSKLPVDCSVFKLELRHSIETNLKDDEYGTLEIKHTLDDHCFKPLMTQIIGPNSWLEVSVEGQEPRQKSQIVISGGFADFEQTENGLEFEQGYSGDADNVIAFDDEQQERYETQKEEYNKQVEETRQLLEARTRRIASAGQHPTIPEQNSPA